MAICDGDMTNYEQIKRLSVEDYLIKLSNFVDKIEPYLKKK